LRDSSKRRLANEIAIGNLNEMSYYKTARAVGTYKGMGKGKLSKGKRKKTAKIGRCPCRTGQGGLLNRIRGAVLNRDGAYAEGPKGKMGTLKRG